MRSSSILAIVFPVVMVFVLVFSSLLLFVEAGPLSPTVFTCTSSSLVIDNVHHDNISIKYGSGSRCAVTVRRSTFKQLYFTDSMINKISTVLVEDCVIGVTHTDFWFFDRDLYEYNRRHVSSGSPTTYRISNAIQFHTTQCAPRSHPYNFNPNCGTINSITIRNVNYTLNLPSLNAITTYYYLFFCFLPLGVRLQSNPSVVFDNFNASISLAGNIHAMDFEIGIFGKGTISKIVATDLVLHSNYINLKCQTTHRFLGFGSNIPARLECTRCWIKFSNVNVNSSLYIYLVYYSVYDLSVTHSASLIDSHSIVQDIQVSDPFYNPSFSSRLFYNYGAGNNVLDSLTATNCSLQVLSATVDNYVHFYGVGNSQSNSWTAINFIMLTNFSLVLRDIVVGSNSLNFLLLYVSSASLSKMDSIDCNIIVDNVSSVLPYTSSNYKTMGFSLSSPGNSSITNLYVFLGGDNLQNFPRAQIVYHSRVIQGWRYIPKVYKIINSTFVIRSSSGSTKLLDVDSYSGSTVIHPEIIFENCSVIIDRTSFTSPFSFNLFTGESKSISAVSNSLIVNVTNSSASYLDLKLLQPHKYTTAISISDNFVQITGRYVSNMKFSFVESDFVSSLLLLDNNMRVDATGSSMDISFVNFSGSLNSEFLVQGNSFEFDSATINDNGDNNNKMNINSVVNQNIAIVNVSTVSSTKKFKIVNNNLKFNFSSSSSSSSSSFINKIFASLFSVGYAASLTVSVSPSILFENNVAILDTSLLEAERVSFSMYSIEGTAFSVPNIFINNNTIEAFLPKKQSSMQLTSIQLLTWNAILSSTSFYLTVNNSKMFVSTATHRVIEELPDVSNPLSLALLVFDAPPIQNLVVENCLLDLDAISSSVDFGVSPSRFLGSFIIFKEFLSSHVLDFRFKNNSIVLPSSSSLIPCINLASCGFYRSPIPTLGSARGTFLFDQNTINYHDQTKVSFLLLSPTSFVQYVATIDLKNNFCENCSRIVGMLPDPVTRPYALQNSQFNLGCNDFDSNVVSDFMNDAQSTAYFSTTDPTCQYTTTTTAATTTSTTTTFAATTTSMTPSTTATTVFSTTSSPAGSSTTTQQQQPSSPPPAVSSTSTSTTTVTTAEPVIVTPFNTSASPTVPLSIIKNEMDLSGISTAILSVSNTLHLPLKLTINSASATSLGSFSLKKSLVPDTVLTTTTSDGTVSIESRNLTSLLDVLRSAVIFSPTNYAKENHYLSSGFYSSLIAQDSIVDNPGAQQIATVLLKLNVFLLNDGPLVSTSGMLTVNVTKGIRFDVPLLVGPQNTLFYQPLDLPMSAAVTQYGSGFSLPLTLRVSCTYQGNCSAKGLIVSNPIILKITATDSASLSNTTLVKLFPVVVRLQVNPATSITTPRLRPNQEFTFTLPSNLFLSSIPVSYIAVRLAPSGKSLPSSLVFDPPNLLGTYNKPGLLALLLVSEDLWERANRTFYLNFTNSGPICSTATSTAESANILTQQQNASSSSAGNSSSSSTTTPTRTIICQATHLCHQTITLSHFCSDTDNDALEYSVDEIQIPVFLRLRVNPGGFQTTAQSLTVSGIAPATSLNTTYTLNISVSDSFVTTFLLVYVVVPPNFAPQLKTNKNFSTLIMHPGDSYEFRYNIDEYFFDPNPQDTLVVSIVPSSQLSSFVSSSSGGSAITSDSSSSSSSDSSGDLELILTANPPDLNEEEILNEFDSEIVVKVTDDFGASAQNIIPVQIRYTWFQKFRVYIYIAIGVFGLLMTVLGYIFLLPSIINFFRARCVTIPNPMTRNEPKYTFPTDSVTTSVMFRVTDGSCNKIANCMKFFSIAIWDEITLFDFSTEFPNWIAKDDCSLELNSSGVSDTKPTFNHCVIRCYSQFGVILVRFTVEYEEAVALAKMKSSGDGMGNNNNNVSSSTAVAVANPLNDEEMKEMKKKVTNLEHLVESLLNKNNTNNTNEDGELFAMLDDKKSVSSNHRQQQNNNRMSSPSFAAAASPFSVPASATSSSVQQQYHDQEEEEESDIDDDELARFLVEDSSNSKKQQELDLGSLVKTFPTSYPKRHNQPKNPYDL